MPYSFSRGVLGLPDRVDYTSDNMHYWCYWTERNIIIEIEKYLPNVTAVPEGTYLIHTIGIAGL
jgi:hypothetical protein